MVISLVLVLWVFSGRIRKIPRWDLSKKSRHFFLFACLSIFNFVSLRCISVLPPCHLILISLWQFIYYYDRFGIVFFRKKKKVPGQSWFVCCLMVFKRSAKTSWWFSLGWEMSWERFLGNLLNYYSYWAYYKYWVLFRRYGSLR